MGNDLLRLVLDHLESRANCPIFVSGAVGSGKTRLSQKVVSRLKEEERTPGGILSPRLMKSGRTVGYDVIDLSTGSRRSFVRTEPPGKRVGKYFLKRGALEFANRAISEAVNRLSPVFIDEIGRLELENGGLAPSVRELLSSDTQGVLLVRDKFLSEVRDFFDIQEYSLVRVN